MRVGWLFAVLLFISSGVAFSQCSPISSCQLAFETTGPEQVKFLMYTPSSYQAGTPAPMLVSLHGIGQIGTNIELLRTQPLDGTPAYIIHTNRWPASRPFIVVSPQLKPDGSGLEQDWTAEVIDEVVEYVKTLRTIDTNRVYFTGLSLGGQGAMIYTMAHPSKVAAMVAMANKTNEIIDNACALSGKPLWMFHGTDDGTVPYSNSIDMYDAIMACPNASTITPHLTTVHAARHIMWNPIYDLTAGYDIYSWLLQFSLNDSSNKPPYVRAGSNKNFLLSEGKFYLHGDAFDSDGEVASLQWTQISGSTLTLEGQNTLTLGVENLQIGTFIFRLTATDNLGMQNHHDVTVQISNTVGSSHAVTDLILYNGSTNSVIGPITDGMVINKSLLEISEFNILAVSNKQGAGSTWVRFRINENQNIITSSVFGTQQAFIIPQQSIPEWSIFPGEYTICGSGTTGNPNPPTFNVTENFSKCIRINVFDQPIKQFYSKAGQDLSLLSSWAANPDGTGAAPESFTGAFQVFNVQTAAQQSQALTIGGVESFLWIRAGGELTLTDNFTGVVNIEGTGIVNINTSQPVSFGSVAPTATVRFGTQATEIPNASYGHVVLQGSTKILPTGTVTLAGDLSIESGASLNGALTGTSTLQVAGDLVVAGSLNPTRKFNLTLTGTQQNLTFNTLAAFNQVTLQADVQATVAGGTPVTLELGTASGGGLVLENNSELMLSDHTLVLSGQGVSTLAPTAHVGFSKGNVIYSSSSTESTLRTKADADSIRALVVNGAGQLTISNTLFVLDSIKISNGILHSNGVTLVSTANQTARIAAFGGTGNLTGSVSFQRHIRSGRMYRYLAFPVSGVSVDSLQEYIPVTGSFSGTSKGAGLNSAAPSLFRYANNQWQRYPTVDSTALFSVGIGYSVFLRNEAEPLTLQVTGPIHRGDFEFTLQPGSSGEDGWSLLGNPYAAPLQWDGSWNASGVGPAVYVRDNESENDRALTWDGETGDAEFGGKIAQGQSFWIKSLTATPALTATESGKTNTGNFFRTNTSPKPAAAITLARGGLIDRAYVKYSESASVTFDATADAHKLKNTTHNLSLVSTDDVLASIKSMPDSCASTIGLVLEDVPAGSYIVSVSGTALDNRVFDLVDLFQDTTVALTGQAGYPFTVTTEAASYGKRFQLITRSTLANPELTLRGDTLFTTATTGLQWLFNGTPIAGASASYWVARQAGLYQVQAQQGGCVKQSAPVMFAITRTKHEPLSVHPNPTQNQVSVNGLTKHSAFTIHDMHGKPLQTGIISPDQNIIDVNLLAGLYILSIHEAPTQRIKLIVK